MRRRPYGSSPARGTHGQTDAIPLRSATSEPARPRAPSSASYVSPDREPALPAAPPAQTLPLSIARVAQREMDRLRRLPAGAPEAAQVRAYLQNLWSLPWEKTAHEDADLRRVETVLHREHLGLSKAKERILEYLAVRRLKPDLPGPALCLVGPPGTGKSSLGAAVARALQRPFARITVSGNDRCQRAGRDRAQLAGRPAGQDPARAAREPACATRCS